MANTLVLHSTNNTGVAHNFEIVDETGAIVAAGAAAAGAGLNAFVVTVPGTLPDGCYRIAMFRTSNGAIRYNGDLCWFGGNVVTEAEYQYLSTISARFDAIDAAHATTASALTNLLTGQGTIQAAQTVILAAVNGLSIPTAVQIATAVEAALLNDGDGQAFRAGLAATIEAAIANEADGNATVAVFQGAVNAALTAYDVATVADAGLTATQDSNLTFVRNVSEADEVYTNGVAQKLLKGTTTVLVDKLVSTVTPCTINTTITEP